MSIEVKDVALEKRHERLSGFLDLELGDKSKWILLFRTPDTADILLGHVHPDEAATVMKQLSAGLKKRT